MARLPMRWEWLWIVPLAFYTSAYGSAMALFAFGIRNLDQALWTWLLMAPAGGLAGLVGFVAAYLPLRSVAGPRVATAAGIAAWLIVATIACGASLTLLGGPA